RHSSLAVRIGIVPPMRDERRAPSHAPRVADDYSVTRGLPSVRGAAFAAPSGQPHNIRLLCRRIGQRLRPARIPAYRRTMWKYWPILLLSLTLSAAQPPLLPPQD